MTKEINAYYENAQLAQAAYAILEEGMDSTGIATALRVKQEENYSSTQGAHFAEKYDVIDSQQNTANGFSATLFEDKAGTYTLAIRGTELIPDVVETANDVLFTNIADIGADGIALKQAVDLFNYYQRLITPIGSQAMQLEYYEGVITPAPNIPYQTILDNGSVPKYRYLNVLPSVEGLGKIPESAEINVAGHSLGGHLALILSRLDPEHINQVYTYNAPGFDTGIIGSDDTEWFFSTVQQLQINEQGASTVSENGFPEDKLNNLVVPLDKISDIGYIPAGQISQFDEGQGYFSAHSIVGMTDALALYSILSNLSPEHDFEQFTSYFAMGANQAEGDLEEILNTLGDVLGFGNTVSAGNRDELYQRIQAISVGIYVNPDVISPIIKPEYQNLEIVSVADLSDAAQLDSPDGFAYRYALVNLNPFAITGDVNLYTQHNQNGELNIDKFSDKYLRDRAKLLFSKNEAYAQDNDEYFNYDSQEGNITYDDLTTGVKGKYLSQDDSISPVSQHVIFATDNGGAIDGASQNDRLYGGNGNDTLKGLSGNDYLEGGKGNDRLYGGNDDDILVGGADDDTYFYNTGEGNDTIIDSDGIGTINWSTVALTGGKTLSENSFLDEENNIYYQFLPEDSNDIGTLVISEKGEAGSIRIQNYLMGSLGLDFNQGNIETPTVDYSYNGSLGESYIGLMEISDELGVDEDEILYSNLEITGVNGQKNVITTGRGNDVVQGGDQNDYIRGGLGDDTSYALSGNDYIDDGWGSDSIFGGDGDDIINLQYGTVMLFYDPETDDVTYDHVSLLTSQLLPLLEYRTDETLFADNVTGRLLYKPVIVVNDMGWVHEQESYKFDAVYSGEVHYQAGTGWDATTQVYHVQIVGDLAYQIGYGDEIQVNVGIYFVEVEDQENTPDYLDGGDGNDLLLANDSSDILNGGSGDDKLVAHGGDDHLYGGLGDDFLIAGEGLDFLDGGSGNDHLYGEDADDNLYGGSGNDVLYGDSPVLAEQYHGNDSLYGESGDDEIYGNLGDDRLYGGTGSDALFGGGDSDELYGEEGNDELYGEEGNDSLYGGLGNDLLIAGDGNDRIDGEDGNDELYGEEGDDTIIGGLGNDLLYGGDGNDIFEFTSGDGIDVIADADGVDSLVFNSLSAIDNITSELVNGADGTYLAIHYSDNDAVYIKDGFESGIASYQFSDGTRLSTRELISATLDSSVDYTSSGSGMPIYGSQFADVLIGSEEVDTLNGGDGDDKLAGAGGNDILSGGLGNDIYYLGLGTGTDLIRGESDESNTLKLLAGVSLSDLLAEKQGNDIHIYNSLSKDGVVIQDYYIGNNEWLIEEQSGTSTTLSSLFNDIQNTKRLASIDVAQTEYIEAVKNFYGSALLARGFQQGEQQAYIKTINSEYSYRGDHFFSTDNYSVTIDVVSELSENEKIVRTLDDVSRDTLLLNSTTDTEELSLLNTENGTYLEKGRSNNGYFVDIHSLSTSLIGNGLSGISLQNSVPVYGQNPSLDALTGEISAGNEILGYWVFPDGDTPRYENNFVSVTRSERQIDYSMQVWSLMAEGSNNNIDLDMSAFNLIDAGEGSDWILTENITSIAIPYGSTSVIGAPGIFLYGNNGDDNLFGTSRQDILIGGTGTDHLYGKGGNDRYLIFSGDDRTVILDDTPSTTTRDYDVIQLPENVSQDDLVLNWVEELAYTDSKATNWAGRMQSMHVALNISWGTPDSLSIVIPHTELNAGYGIEYLIMGDGTQVKFSSLVEQAGTVSNVDLHNQANSIAGIGQIFGGLGDDTLTSYSTDDGTLNNTLIPIAGTASEDSLEYPTYTRLVGGGGYDHLYGGDGKDELIGGNIFSTNVIVHDGESFYAYSDMWDNGNFYKGGKGNDYIWTTAGDDIIEYNLGDGVDHVTDFYHSSVGLLTEERWANNDILTAQQRTTLLEGEDILRFGDDILASDVSVETFQMHGRLFTDYNSLIFTLSDGGMLAFDNWSGAAYNQLTRVEFADGTVWEGSLLEAIINGETINSEPIANTSLSNYEIDELSEFNYALPSETFTDPDSGDELSFSASLSGGNALPAWLNFDISTQTFNGTPTIDASGDYNIIVTATDIGGLGASQSFILRVADINPDISGTDTGDELIGTIHGEQMNGAKGNDVLQGLAGDDNLNGSYGDDLLIGGQGNDYMEGSYGRDTYLFNQGDGEDYIKGDNTDKVLFGEGISAEQLHIVQENNQHIVIYLLDDNGTQTGDSLTLHYGTHYQGNELLSLHFADGSTLTGDDIKAQSLLVEGSSGDDNLQGSYGNDHIYGYQGNDQLFGSLGNDYLDGGEGDDSLYGYARSNILIGGKGNDYLEGGINNDTYIFNQGDGQDYIKGDSADIIQFGDGISAAQLYIVQENNQHIVIYLLDDNGTQTGDSLTLHYGTHYQGNELLSLHFADGSTLTGDDIKAQSLLVEGSSGDDNLQGSYGNDQIYGYQGNDQLFGSLGNDYLDGGEGDDSLYGYARSNILIGGKGNDYLEGGYNDDTYLFQDDFGHDVINNHNSLAADDKITFSDVDYQSLWFEWDEHDLNISVVGTDNDVTISGWFYGGRNTISDIEASGYHLTDVAVEQLVSAMASFDAPTGAGSVIPEDVKEQLQPVMAEVWH